VTESRRRGAVLDEAILGAAVAELTEHGYPGLTMDAVAKRAGTNKNAVYRRWPNRAALGVAAYRRLAATDQEPPDTGELRGDALALLRRVNRDSSSAVAAIHRSLVSSLSDDPDLLAQMQEHALTSTTSTWLMVLGRAVARGEVRPEALHPRVATVALTLLRNDYITRGVCPVSDDVVMEIVDEVFLPLVHGRGAR
jgi:AcrR family transcriptional regulator